MSGDLLKPLGSATLITTPTPNVPSGRPCPTPSAGLQNA